MRVLDSVEGPLGLLVLRTKHINFKVISLLVFIKTSALHLQTTQIKIMGVAEVELVGLV